MTARSQQEAFSSWPAWPWFPWTSSVQALGSAFTPQQVNQAINPGWIFAQGVTINAQNSSSPETERDIVALESYGRQIGRISDALAILISERRANAPVRAEYEAFNALHEKILEIKTRASHCRVERLLKDLDQMRRDAPADYARVAAILHEVS
jgi:molecular chaperone DnaK (HSP70)